MILTQAQFVEQRSDELTIAKINFARANAECLNKETPREWGAMQLALRLAKRNFKLAMSI